MANRKIDEATGFQSMVDVLTGLLNTSSGCPILAEGTNANTLKTQATINFCVNGIPYTAYAATDNIAMTACTTQAVSTYCKYLVTIDSAALVTVTKGDDAATAALALLPALPATGAPIGYFQILTDSTHTFTSGTTDLSAAGITDTYGDLNSVVTIS